MSRGDLGEQLAAEYLIQRGYEIPVRNYRTKYGEVDLIASQGDTLAFVEVKARSGTRFGLPYEAVNVSKQMRICRAAGDYLSKNSGFKMNVRFDIIEVYLKSGKINHIENAFEFKAGDLLL
jgi:putative endonuclease